MFDNSLEAYGVIENTVGNINSVADAYFQNADISLHQLTPVVEPLPLTKTVDIRFEFLWQQPVQLIDSFLDIPTDDLLAPGSDDPLYLVNSEIEPDSLLVPNGLGSYGIQRIYGAASQNILNLVNDLANGLLDNLPGLSRLLELVFPDEMPIPTTPIVKPPASPLPEDIQALVQIDLAKYLGVSAAQITLQEYSRQTWSDGCFGLGGPAELCLAALTEGWQVEVVDTETDETYRYRTNLSGDHIRREFDAPSWLPALDIAE